MKHASHLTLLIF